MEERIKTYYPGYNVMDQAEHWDDHTREIVHKRLDIPGHFSQLTDEEVEQIKALAALLIDDGRSLILDYIVKHFDTQLGSDIGEGHRMPNVPPFRTLVKKGLEALDRLARQEHDRAFVELSVEQQIALLVGLENDTLRLQSQDGTAIPAVPFFKKMLSETVSAYYSHPLIWSEIGYGGPAYPRGYVRTELGLTDPWEARKDA
jgi:hypothetical protein